MSVISVDHFTPRSVVPELANVIANFGLLPPRMNVNESKKDKMGARQTSLAKDLRQAGLLRP